MPIPLHVTFVGSAQGQWRIIRNSALIGEGIPSANYLSVLEGQETRPLDCSWVLRGMTSNTRYTNKSEVGSLAVRQANLRRPEAHCAALIPIRKKEAWWGLAQDERRAIFEEQSHHIGIGLDYLPAIARRLHHSRELAEPFDFLTWFEYAPENADAFEEMVGRLRETAEWQYVDREVDLRLVRA